MRESACVGMVRSMCTCMCLCHRWQLQRECPGSLPALLVFHGEEVGREAGGLASARIWNSVLEESEHAVRGI